MDDQGRVTDLIHRAQGGEAEAASALVELVYPELRRLARARLRGGGRAAQLDTTSVVHEWYLRFVRVHGVPMADRAHFLRHAAAVMRSVIVDEARRRGAARRGGQVEHVGITGRAGTGEEEILRVHQAVEELARLDPRLARVVELRYFAGLTEAEIGAALGFTERTVRRDWDKARLLLAEALRA